MKKLQLFVVLLAVTTLFAFTDYRLNIPEGINIQTIPSIVEKPVTETPVAILPNITQMILDGSGMSQIYKIEKRTRTTELFELFNLSNVTNISVFNNLLITNDSATSPIYAYEIHGVTGQGKITYLNLKLKIIDQLGSAVDINETGGYGVNSLFYNNESNPNSGYLLSQIGDVVFGFKYSKIDGKSFDSVKQFVEYYMSQVTN